MRGTRLITAIAAIAAGLASAWSGPAAAQQVGSVASEKATISRAGVRVQRGGAIAMGDRLTSNASGEGVIVFRDESSARMGPNADLTIDEFVYDPGRHTGRIRLRQSNGLARIYGGQISKRGSVEIRTPHIVLGVRGGIADLAVEGGQTVATLRGGRMTCTAGGRSRTVTNPGISCVSDGSSLDIGRVAGSGNQLVVPAAPGQGASADGRYDAAHCASGAGIDTPYCRSRDGRLPRPDIGRRGGEIGNPGGGVCASKRICP